MFFPDYITWSCSFLKINFVIFFTTKLSLSHNLGERFVSMTQVFFRSLFFIFFILSLKTWFFLKINFFPVLSFIELSYSYDLTRKFWRPHLVLLVLCFKVFFFIDFFFLSHHSTFWLLGIDNHYFFQLSFYEVEWWIFFCSLKYIGCDEVLFFYIEKKLVRHAAKRKPTI